ncbi:MAG: hypothetical protein ACE5HY_00935 [Candidatus Hydrothermarchaeales archaeon]
MREIQLSDKTFKELVKLKNHWSFQYRRVTNPDVLKLLDKHKKEIFGYDSSASMEEIEQISNQKSRDQLEDEMERFNRALNELLVSGYDFEPGYTFDEHVKKMIEAIEENAVSPYF